MIPTHVSIIMDGNGRWAQERGMQRGAGHIAGVESVRKILQESVRQGVKYLSLYAFSEENWNRNEAEVTGLMHLFMKYTMQEQSELMQEGVRFMVLGNRERLSRELNDVFSECERRTAGNNRVTIILFVSYSGKWDILQAAKRFALDAAKDPSAAQNATLDDFGKYLCTAGIPDPDLIIRTSGEQRISNYLLWQAAYSEFYYTDVLWPDFDEEQFRIALEAYAKRDRRYGKTK